MTRRLNDVLLKLMEGRPGDLTQIECLDVVQWLAEWVEMRPKASGAPAKDNFPVALDYWSRVLIGAALPKNAKSDVGEAWGISAKRVAEIAAEHASDARSIVAGRPKAFLRVMAVHAAKNRRKGRTPKK